MKVCSQHSCPRRLIAIQEMVRAAFAIEHQDEAVNLDPQILEAFVRPVYRIHAPTGPLEVCASCAPWARRVFEILGCHVHVEQLPAPATDDASRRFGLIEVS